MNISDAKKVILDSVNLSIEETQLRDEIQATKKQIKNLEYWVDELQMQYDDLVNSATRQFFLGLIGKKEERIQEAENEVRQKKGELSSARFELESLERRLEDIEQTRKEIDTTCKACLAVISEVDGETTCAKLQAISELPKLCMEITNQLAAVKSQFTTAYDIYQTVTGRPTSPGTYINKDSEMRKQSRVIEKGINHILELLNAYNLYAPEEIKIEYHSKWMEKDNYWEEQQMAYDTMERVKVVEEWFFRLDNCWKAMRKQQKEALKKVEEEVLEYLDS